ncbi:MAG: hypothetical protein QXF26_09110 [Candidatus Bathyarchaeia archaeon]
MLLVDGALVAERTGTGNIQVNRINVTIGGIFNGLGYFDGVVSEVKVSDVARSVGWIKTEYNNQSSPSSFYRIGKEERIDSL